jgi:protein SMG7
MAHNPLTMAIGDGRFDIHNGKERDEDAMTENTSRTDDDPVGDAFRHALDADLEDDDDGNDEIVWNPRCVNYFIYLLLC